MPRPLHVLHVVTTLQAGGMENGVVNLAAKLDPRGITSHVACLESGGAFADRLPPSSRVAILGKRNGFSPAAAVRLAFWQRRLEADIIHTHNLGPLIYGVLGTAFGFTATILHGEHSQLAPWETQPRRLFQRRLLYRACRRLHAVSRGMVEQFAALGLPAQDFALTSNGVDIERFRPGDRGGARTRFGLPATARVVGIVGRFGPFKRHLALIEAFETLAPEWPDLHLLIAGGGGSEEEKVRRRAEESLCAGRIHWAGAQSEPEHCYRALDLLAIPSVNEGFSNVALEAMASEVPVLANTECGHEEIFASGSEGVMVDLRKPEELVRQLAHWLRSPEEWRQMGIRGRERAVRLFSLDAMADRYEALYRETAGRA